MNLSRNIIKRGITMIKTSKHSRVSHPPDAIESMNGETLSQTSDATCSCSNHHHHHHDLPKGEGGVSTQPCDVDNGFDCNICLELPQDPVVTMCGHLFCWSCLYRWLRSGSQSHFCPVCKAVVSRETVIPLYGRGKPNTSKTYNNVVEENIPSRPMASRPTHGDRGSNNSRIYRQVPHVTSFHNHGISFQQSNVVYRAHVPFSASFGLFPSLFGFYMSDLPDYSTGSSMYSTHETAPMYESRFGFPTASTMVLHQRRLLESQEFILYWFFILLACFAVGCLLVF